MSEFIPTNDLDRALMALQRSLAATPDFYRALAEGELWFLVKYHPEIEGEVLELKNGAPVPFVSFQEKEGPAVALFSSDARLDEGLKKGRVPARTFSGGSMPAKQLLEILGQMEFYAVVNKGCATGQIVIPPDLMRDLASGKALAPSPLNQGRKRGVLKIINPADYPTDLVQPAFEFMRRHQNFRAAWIFDSSKVVDQPVAGRCYQFLFLMQPRDEVIFHDLNMTIQAARIGADDDVGLGLLDETDGNYIANLFRQAPPFFKAADYLPPSAKPT